MACSTCNVLVLQLFDMLDVPLIKTPHVSVELRMHAHPQRRAIALERLSRALSDISDRGVLLSALPALIAYLLGLAADRNSKMGKASMQMLGDLAEEVGQPMQSQLG